MTENELVVANYNLPAINEDIQESMQEILDSTGMTFDQLLTKIKIPSGGGLSFELPNPENPDEPIIERELEGVILIQQNMNIYYANPYSGDIQAPDCLSIDGKIGVGNPGGSCSNCQLNKFQNNRKECKNKFRIYVLQSGQSLPFIIDVPPTSTTVFKDFISKQIGINYPKTQVVTKISLKKAKSKDNIEYSQLKFGISKILTPDEGRALKQYAEQLKKTINECTATKEVQTSSVVDDGLPYMDGEIQFEL